MATDRSQENTGRGISVSGRAYFEECAPLHTAALKGDWEEANRLLDGNSELVRTYITEGKETALHIAAAEGHAHFVENLLENMRESDLEIQNGSEKTALCFAAVAGHVDIARLMVQKNPDIIRGEKRVAPLDLAAWQGHKEMAEYLFDEEACESWTQKDQINVLTKCIHSGLYGLAVRIVKKSPELAVAKDEYEETPLQVLASKPLAFRRTNRQGFGRNIVNTISSYRKLKAHNASARDDARNTSAPGDAPNTSAPGDAPNTSAPDCAPNTSAPGDAGNTSAPDDAGNTSARDDARNTSAPGDAPNTSARGDARNTSARDGNTSAPDDAYTLLDHLWRGVKCQHDAETGRRLGSIKNVPFVAAKSGNVNFLVELIRRCPDLIYPDNMKGHSIFHIAVSQRHRKVFNLTYELRGIKDLIISFIDKEKNNILHLAAKLAPQCQLNRIPVAALQMQREVLWYKEVQKIVPLSYRNMKNQDGRTPYELFLEEHKVLMKEGERQMKQIAKSCMLVTVLIATIVFTAAFTVPGGYNNNTGAPILQHEKLFTIFTISEVVAILASLTSMLMFLSVLTSRYSDNDFLMRLPLWLVAGVAALFVSIVAMMGAFYSCLLCYELGRNVSIFLLVLFISVPIMFGILKWRLLVAIVSYLCRSKSLFGSENRLFSNAVEPDQSQPAGPVGLTGPDTHSEPVA